MSITDSRRWVQIDGGFKITWRWLGCDEIDRGYLQFYSMVPLEKNPAYIVRADIEPGVKIEIKTISVALK